ncbi:Fpg/Nei family DNA glycosylase [Aquibacillus kalidii]|uniref:Fpg/Nei family DNA glycosylase n=1 Tax=Aquibacillus kalidii TaxID=2762597 RepID=UPI001644E85B|nr:Fpg/Nei family DNA glycosylase [Aquibacillus kalidii]
MPELPEMENYRTLLTDKIKDKAIKRIEVNRAKSVNLSVNEFINRTKMQSIIAIERRAKHLVFHLQSGDVLLLHLMLGGWMFYGNEEDKPDRTIQVQLSFGEESLYFIGLRLGYLHLLTKQQVVEKLSDLGPEPLDINFSTDQFLEIVKNKRGKLKTTLVDQHFLAGIGNRYSDEICWSAQLLPTHNINELSEQELITLYQSIRATLQQAISGGGYMDERLYKDDTKTGSYLTSFHVYNREGDNCSRCGNKIIKEEVSSRKTYFCTGCQK